MYQNTINPSTASYILPLFISSGTLISQRKTPWEPLCLVFLFRIPCSSGWEVISLFEIGVIAPSAPWENWLRGFNPQCNLTVQLVPSAHQALVWCRVYWPPTWRHCSRESSSRSSSSTWPPTVTHRSKETLKTLEPFVEIPIHIGSHCRLAY